MVLMSISQERADQVHCPWVAGKIVRDDLLERRILAECLVRAHCGIDLGGMGTRLE